MNADSVGGHKVYPLNQQIRGFPQIARLGALARLELGRAYEMSGDTAKTKAAYKEFLTLWKDGDPDIPTLSKLSAQSSNNTEQPEARNYFPYFCSRNAPTSFSSPA